MGTHGEIHNDNIIKATMEELTEDERKAYLIAEEHLREHFLQGFKKERGGLFKRVGGVRDTIVQFKPRQSRGTS